MGEIQQEYYLKGGKEILQHCQLLKTLFIQFKNGNKLFPMMPNSGLIHSKHAIKTCCLVESFLGKICLLTELELSIFPWTCRSHTLSFRKAKYQQHIRLEDMYMNERMDELDILANLEVSTH